MNQFLKVFFKGKVTGYGSWPRHVASWLDCPYYGTDRLLVLRYEELRRDPEAGFMQMLKFAGLERDPERVRRAVANNSVEQMRAKELQSPRKASVRGQFIRAGKVKGWEGKFTQDQLEMIDDHAGEVMERMGYERTPSRSAPISSETLVAAKH